MIKQKYFAIKVYDYETKFMICDNLLQALNSCRIDMKHQDTVFHGRQFQINNDGSYTMTISRDYIYKVVPIIEGKWFTLKCGPKDEIIVEQHDTQVSADHDAFNHWLSDIDTTVGVISPFN